MALYPCSVDGARYRGASAAMYPAVVHGRDSSRAHLRLCQPHFQSLQTYCKSHLEEVVYDQPEPVQEALPTCALCGGKVDGNLLAFVTAYPEGSEEVQYYGKLCTPCSVIFSREMHIDR